MYNLIKTKYFVIISVLMFGSFVLTQLYSEGLGVSIGVSKKLASEISFIVIVLILFLIGMYIDKFKFNKIKNTNYKIISYRNYKEKILFICIAIVTLIVYIYISINSSYSLFILWWIIVSYLMDVFFGKAYINSEIIIIGNKVINISEIDKVEISKNSFDCKLIFRFKEENKTVDFISYELRDYILNIIGTKE